LNAKEAVRAQYPDAWACRFPDVVDEARGGVLMRGYWVIYATRRSRRRLGHGRDPAAAWRDAAVKMLEEE
jgi:hypothetical protein